MNISMFTTYAFEQQKKGNFQSGEEALSHFYTQGIRYGDILEDELAEYPLHLYCRMLHEAGLKPGCLITLSNIAAFDRKERERSLAMVKGYLDQMEKLGIPLLMPAPVVQCAGSPEEFARMREIMVESLNVLTEYAKDSGIRVAIENQSVLTRADSKMADIRYLLEAVPDLGYILDAGNFFCVGEDVEKAYELLVNRLVHVHFKDWQWDPYGAFVRENMPRFNGVVLGKGLIALREVIQKLKRDGYEGNIVLEINSCDITLEQLDASAAFLRQELFGEF